MAAADQVFWGFIFYVKNNPHKSMDNMTEDDFDEMVRQYAFVNQTAGITAATAPDFPSHYGYGVVDLTAGGVTLITFPAAATATKWAADGAGIVVAATYLLNMVAVKQAQYPEDHRD